LTLKTLRIAKSNYQDKKKVFWAAATIVRFIIRVRTKAKDSSKVKIYVILSFN
jgi:hypothetical protein